MERNFAAPWGCHARWRAARPLRDGSVARMGIGRAGLPSIGRTFRHHWRSSPRRSKSRSKYCAQLRSRATSKSPGAPAEPRARAIGSPPPVARLLLLATRRPPVAPQGRSSGQVLWAGPLARSPGQVPRPGPRGQVPRPGPPGQVHGRRALPPILAAVCRAPCDLLPAVGQGVHPICTGVNASGQEQPEAAALERSPWGNRRPFQLQDQARTALGTALAILCFGLGCVLGVCLAVCPACWCA